LVCDNGTLQPQPAVVAVDVDCTAVVVAAVEPAFSLQLAVSVFNDLS